MGTVTPEISILLLLNFSDFIWSRVPTISASDFDGLSFKSLNINHRATDVAQSFKRDKVEVASASMLKYKVISSAYDTCLTSKELMSLSMGETYAENSRGPKTEPCGTPDSEQTVTDAWSLTFTK